MRETILGRSEGATYNELAKSLESQVDSISREYLSSVFKMDPEGEEESWRRSLGSRQEEDKEFAAMEHWVGKETPQEKSRGLEDVLFRRGEEAQQPREKLVYRNY